MIVVRCRFIHDRQFGKADVFGIIGRGADVDPHLAFDGKKLVRSSPTRSKIRPEWIMMMPIRLARSLNRTVWAASRFTSMTAISRYPPGMKKVAGPVTGVRRLAGLAGGRGLEVVKIDLGDPAMEKLFLDVLNAHLAAVVPASTRTMHITNRTMVSRSDANGARMVLSAFNSFHRKVRISQGGVFAHRLSFSLTNVGSALRTRRRKIQRSRERVRQGGPYGMTRFRYEPTFTLAKNWSNAGFTFPTASVGPTSLKNQVWPLESSRATINRLPPSAGPV